jgi:hypothetical protein
MQNNLSKQEKDYLINILEAEKELNTHNWGSSAKDSNNKIDNIIKKLNLKEKHLNK